MIIFRPLNSCDHSHDVQLNPPDNERQTIDRYIAHAKYPELFRTHVAKTNAKDSKEEVIVRVVSLVANIDPSNRAPGAARVNNDNEFVMRIFQAFASSFRSSLGPTVVLPLTIMVSLEIDENGCISHYEIASASSVQYPNNAIEEEFRQFRATDPQLRPNDANGPITSVSMRISFVQNMADAFVSNLGGVRINGQPFNLLQ